MKLSETNNVFPLVVSVNAGVVSNELRLCDEGVMYVALDQTTAKEFLPVLQHFIETGEMLK